MPQQERSEKKVCLASKEAVNMQRWERGIFNVSAIVVNIRCKSSGTGSME